MRAHIAIQIDLITQQGHPPGAWGVFGFNALEHLLTAMALIPLLTLAMHYARPGREGRGAGRCSPGSLTADAASKKGGIWRKHCSWKS